jgi:viologen exporter family transport system permease protein
VVDGLLVYRRLIAAQLRSQLQYRASFALDLAGTFLISFIDFLAVLVLFHNVPRLAGWSVHEVAFLYATSSVAFALADLIVGHLESLSQRLRTGTFDILLVRPRGTLFQMVASELALRRLGRFAQGAVVLGYALAGSHIDWNVGRALVFAAMIPSGFVIFAAVWIAGMCVMFWTTEGGEFTNAFTYGGQFLTQYPMDIYSAWLRRFLAYLVPMAFVSYFPALYILGKDDALGLPRLLQFSSPLVAVAAVSAAGLVWRAAVRRYRSAGG